MKSYQLLWKCSLITQIFPKVAGVLKLNYYWFKGFRKAASAVLEQFPKAASAHLNEFTKPLVLTIFRGFVPKFTSGVLKAVNIGLAAFGWKLFYDYIGFP